MDERGAIEVLKGIGLTSYEAKCYTSLARLGPADPRKVAADAGIPNPSAYEALKRLAAKGWVDLVRKRPATYRARKPSGVKSMVSSRMEEAFEMLEKLYSAEPAEDAELVYTLRDREKVMAKIYELLGGAKQSVMLVAPTMGLEDARLLEMLNRAVRRGVKVRAVGDEGAAGILPPGIQIRTGNLVAVDLLVDDSVALISLPDYSACGWIDSPQVAEHFKQFLELMWSTSSPA